MSSYAPMSDSAAISLLRMLAKEAIKKHPIYQEFQQAIRDLNDIAADKKISRDKLNAVISGLECLLFEFED
jgi:cell fate (sporulation/competence/biofilm development) regulator YmcA (YheA/YmcA/DUF963 family)